MLRFAFTKLFNIFIIKKLENDPKTIVIILSFLHRFRSFFVYIFCKGQNLFDI